MQKFSFSSLFSKLKWQKCSLVERGAIAINIPLLCLVISLGTHIFIRQLTILSEVKVEHTQTTLQESRTLLVDMLNAETGVRGYYITRQSTFLEPYNYGATKLPKTLVRLKELVSTHPEQARRIATIATISDRRLAMFKDRIGKVQSGEFTIGPSGSNLSLIEGKQTMDRFRQLLAEFSALEERNLNSGYKDLQQFRDLNILVIVLGVAISGLGGAFAAKLFRSLAKELDEREFKLTASNNLIRAVFSNVVDGAIVLDATGQITECNDAATAMFGYDRAALVGQNWTLLFGSQSQNIVPLHTSGKLKIAKGGHLWQTMGQHQNGDYFPIEVSIGRIDIESDDRQIAIVRDLTARQQTEAKLQSRAAELAQLNVTLRRTNSTLKDRNRELDRFAYVTSHDLKAPLRAIANLSDWIAEDLGKDLPIENQNQLRLLRGRVDRMEGLLNGLLDYSRVGRRHIPIESVDVNQLVAETIANIRPPETFKIEIASNLPKLSARRSLLKQVFHSLIDNAIEHHPSSHGTITITTTDLGDRYEFAIADDGQGIEPEYHERIYNIFQTLKARDTHESTGVGLAIVKKIIETEGGTIRLQSSLGQGATFYFSWLKQPIESIYTEDYQDT